MRSAKKRLAKLRAENAALKTQVEILLRTFTGIHAEVDAFKEDTQMALAKISSEAASVRQAASDACASMWKQHAVHDDLARNLAWEAKDDVRELKRVVLARTDGAVKTRVQVQ